jgi:hypothetical protein
MCIVHNIHIFSKKKVCCHPFVFKKREECHVEQKYGNIKKKKNVLIIINTRTSFSAFGRGSGPGFVYFDLFDRRRGPDGSDRRR